MFGFPNQTIKDWKETLEKVCSIKSRTYICYSLIIEEETVFYNVYEKGYIKFTYEEDEREYV